MANNHNISEEILFDGVLQGFMAAIAPIAVFSLNASPESGLRGSTVKVHRFNSAVDDALTKAPRDNYDMQDTDSDEIEITLGDPKYVSMDLSDNERMSDSRLNIERFAQRKGHRLATHVLQDILSVVTAANFGAAGFTGAASTFDEDEIVDIRTLLDDDDVPEEGTALLLKPAYYNELLKQAGIKDVSAYGFNAIQSGEVPMISGFRVVKSNLIPDNSQNLVGMAVHPDAIVSAFRYFEPDSSNKYTRAEPLIDPNGSGMTLGLRDWYDENSGARKTVIDCQYGFAVGLPSGLKRIVSA